MMTNALPPYAPEYATFIAELLESVEKLGIEEFIAGCSRGFFDDDKFAEQALDTDDGFSRSVGEDHTPLQPSFWSADQSVRLRACAVSLSRCAPLFHSL
jgi:hypothetical protein